MFWFQSTQKVDFEIFRVCILLRFISSFFKTQSQRGFLGVSLKELKSYKTPNVTLPFRLHRGLPVASSFATPK